MMIPPVLKTPITVSGLPLRPDCFTVKGVQSPDRRVTHSRQRPRRNEPKFFERFLVDFHVF